MGDKVIMPKRLTAENGAKAAMIGEYEVVTGYYVDDDGVEKENVIDIPWTTIKQIYKDAVELLGEDYE